MEQLLSPGRHVWSVTNFDGITSVVDFTVITFGRFLPAGPLRSGDPPSYNGHRQHSLVELYTDPGGKRTLAVADLRLKKPQGVRVTHGFDDD